MLSFKQFITEENVDVPVDIELKNAPLGDIEKINADLDAVTEDPFVNTALFVNAVRGTLERYGILLPEAHQWQALDMEGEYTYSLGDSGHYVYMVHNLSPEGHVEGYATIATQDELNALADLGNVGGDEVSEPPETKPWTPPARRDDDSGNDAEYA